MKCPAELKISLRKRYQDFVLFRFDDHSHDENEAPPKKLDPKALEKIAEYQKLGISPRLISHNLRDNNEIQTAPTNL